VWDPHPRGAALADGAGAADAVEAAVAAASEWVGRGAPAPGDTPAAVPKPASVDGALEVIGGVRAVGGTVVATGGCFDLLHTGHVRTLEAARALGDCLVVCLNSDRSVRRLKGADRPLVGQEDRAAVLLALGCVDGVVIFDEDTPGPVLERLRPDLWAKGGDYAAAELPEAAVLERWGGRVVLVPYVDGRSTTRLLEEAVLRAV
jgi:rfaE bifunctional protein nucleotidyltransferase chain/domain